MTYNQAGQKIDMHDPDMGRWTYTYDGAGNLWTQTDNRGCVTTFGYDSANRLKLKDYGAATSQCPATADVTYTYVPQSQPGAGQRKTMTDANSKTTWTYDTRGLPIQEERVITTSVTTAYTYTTGFSYDDLGRLLDVTYPNGEVVRQAYTDPGRAGNVTSLISQEASYAGAQTYASGFTYDAEGRLTHIDYGNGVYTNLTFYPWGSSNSQGGQLQYLRTKKDATDLQVFDYQYDPVGNLKLLYDPQNGNERLYFTYDHLNRLDAVSTTGTGAAPVNVDYVYDEIGNLRTGEAGVMTYGPAQPASCREWNGQPHAVYGVGGYIQAYDCNGNQTVRREPTGTYTQTWDYENRLITVVSPTVNSAITTTFTYDGDGQRLVQSRSDGSKVIYVNRYYEIECLKMQPPTLTGPAQNIPPGVQNITWNDVFSEQYYDLAIDDTGTGTNPDQAVTLGADVTSYAFNFQASHTYNITIKSRTDCYGASGPSQTLSVAVSTNVSATQTAQAALTLTAQAVTVTPTATPSRTATATATATRTSTPTATVTGSGTQLTRQVAASSDDVNEDGATFDSAGTTVWLGTGGSTSASYTGFRFTNIAIPQGATITSAKLQVYVPATTWTQIDFSYAAENVANSATFSSSSKPSQRTLTTQTVSHSSNAQWTASTWYDLDEIKTVVQPVISRADWASGNALSIILKGTGSAYGRKSVTSYDGTPANAVRLVITYTTGGPTPTHTPTPTATATRTNTPTSTATGTSGSCSVLDNFNRANGAIGSGWSGNTATTQYQITSNQLDVVHSGDAGPIFWNATSFGTTQQACVKLAAIDANADEVALVLKSQSSTSYSSGALEVLYYPSGSVVRVFTYDSGNGWVQRGSDIGTTFAAGDTLRVVARSNGQVEVYKNASLLGTRDASAWTYSGQGGYIGLWSILGPNTMFDDFGGGTYSGSSAADIRAMGASKTVTTTISCPY